MEILLTLLQIDGHSVSVARAQLTEFTQSEPRSNDALTSTELALLVATDQDLSQFSAATDQEHVTSEEILLCSETGQIVEGDQELPLQQKISERLRFSNYLVCPIRLSYRKMYDTTALTLFLNPSSGCLSIQARQKWGAIDTSCAPTWHRNQLQATT